MPKISLICVTNRKHFEDVLFDDVARQTFQDFEVIIADDNCESNEPTHLWFKPRQKNEGDVWNLNKAYNDCLDRATGELLVFLQDFIWIPDEGLKKFWDAYQKHPNALVTGVGHKALNGLEGVSEPDRRMESPKQGLDYCDPMIVPWELNWASCPRKIMPRFNEEMDRFYGGENLWIQKAAILRGADMMIDRSNRCIGYSQEFCGGRPDNWEEMHSNKNGRLAAFLKYLDLTEGKGV
ncbi:MAG: glycosyltransferase [Patescibacteria group bacterium]|nr:glycosyltransferase [Patescibacteria group bacterium]